MSNCINQVSTTDQDTKEVLAAFRELPMNEVQLVAGGDFSAGCTAIQSMITSKD